MLEGQVRGGRAVGQGDVQQQQMDNNHEQRLDEERGAEVGAEPVEDLEDAGDQHDEGDVEREAGRAARPVHRVDLVAIAGDGARGDAVACVSARVAQVARRRRSIQNGRNVLHHGAQEVAHGVTWVTACRRCGARG